MSYSDDLKHPKWQERRLRVFSLAGFKCARCGSGERQLHAHHKLYLRGHKPWEYEDALLECLCELCHDAAHADQEALEYLIAQQPTASLPMMTDAVAASLTNEQADSALSPKMRAVFRQLGHALCGSDPDALIHAQNALQDLVDEHRDFRRGPGGTWRAAA